MNMKRNSVNFRIIVEQEFPTSTGERDVAGSYSSGAAAGALVCG